MPFILKKITELSLDGVTFKLHDWASNRPLYKHTLRHLLNYFDVSKSEFQTLLHQPIRVRTPVKFGHIATDNSYDFLFNDTFFNIPRYNRVRCGKQVLVAYFYHQGIIEADGSLQWEVAICRDRTNNNFYNNKRLGVPFELEE